MEWMHAVKKARDVRGMPIPAANGSSEREVIASIHGGVGEQYYCECMVILSRGSARETTSSPVHKGDGFTTVQQQ